MIAWGGDPNKHEHIWRKVRTVKRKHGSKTMIYRFYKCYAKNCPAPDKMEIETKNV